jgi:tRNA nucleotidyltransferase (CCA-adding enzyme)
MAEARRMPLYIVGGFVRDLLLRQPGLDLDLVVEGDAIALALALAAKHGGKVTAHKRFGTAQWFLPESLLITRHSSLDLISARSETYPRPGALPVVRPGTLTDDLRRRDFTINTLALRLDSQHFGELRDDLGGLDDLEKGLVRALHPHSYIDDPTRILRAIRYEQRYGFRIADEDLALITAARPLLGRLSGERLRHELDLLLAEVKSAAMLARSAELGILTEIHPLLAWNASLRPVFEKLDQPEPDSWRGVPDLARVPRRIALGYLLWLSDLDALVIESLAAGLDFTASLREALLASSALHTELPALADAKPSVITAHLDEVPLLAVCALSVESAPIRLSASKSVDEYLSRWRHIKPKTTGHTLIKLGIPPGPAYQTILNRLRTAWLDGEVKTVEEEKKLLDKLTKSV